MLKIGILLFKKDYYMLKVFRFKISTLLIVLGGMFLSNVALSTQVAKRYTNLYVYDGASYNSQTWEKTASNVDHVLFGFWSINANGHIYLPEPALDINDNIAKQDYSIDDAIASFKSNLAKSSMLNKLCNLRISNSNIKFIISIGGWGGSDKFSQGFSRPSGRKNFVDDVDKIFNNFQCGDGKKLFTGVDIDWEYPVKRIDFSEKKQTVNPQDTQNLHTLMAYLRARVGQDKIIAMALPHGNDDADGGSIYNYFIKNNNLSNAQFIENTSFFTIMSYDFMAFAKTTVTNAPLFDTTAGGKQTIDMGVQALIKEGVPSGKISLGIPLYGRAILYDYNSKYPGKTICISPNEPQPFAGNYAGIGYTLPPFVDTNGSQPQCAAVWILYQDINVDNLQKSIQYDQDVAQYGYYWTTPESNFVKVELVKGSLADSPNGYFSFDTPDTVTRKVQYVKDHQLAGISFWEASQDKPYNDDTININGTQYYKSLVRTVNKDFNK